MKKVYLLMNMPSFARARGYCLTMSIISNPFSVHELLKRDLWSIGISGVTRSMVIPGPETEVIGESGSGGLREV